MNLYFSIKKDFQCNNSLISRLVILIYRFGNTVYYKVKIPLLRQVLWLIYRVCDLVIIKICSNSDIPAQAEIGQELYLPHGGKGIVIHPGVKIGDKVTIYHQVTIGVSKHGGQLPPQIGNNVFIGTGAKVLGSIVLGDYASVGANAVVLNNIPPCTTAVGIPAKVINKNSNLMVN